MINVVILLAIIIVNLTIGIVSYFKTGDWRLLLIASIIDSSNKIL